MKNYLNKNKSNTKLRTGVKNCANTMQHGATKNKTWYPDIGVAVESGSSGIIGDIRGFLGI